MYKSKRVVIPFKVHSNLVVVPVLLDAKLPLKFVLDSGVPTTIITEKTYADILNFNYGRQLVIYGAGGETILEAYIASNVDIDLPGVKGTGHSVLVLQKDYMELKKFLGTDVHGILGYELFSKFVIKFDYINQRLVLYDPETYKKPNKYEEMPLSIEDTKPYVYSKVYFDNGGHINGKFLIDTGSSSGLIIDPDTDDRIAIPVKNLDTNLGRGLSGHIYGKIGRVQSMNMGSYKMEEVIASFPNPGSYVADSIKSTEAFRNGSIGGEILSRFHVIFDYPHGKLYFKKNSKFKKDFDFNLSGIVLKVEGKNFDRFVISEVRTGSAAYEAQLQKGDQIIKINNASTSSLKLQQIIGLLNAKPGKKVKLEVVRNQKLIRLDLILSRQI